jgi:hypothetical protein
VLEARFGVADDPDRMRGCGGVLAPGVVVREGVRVSLLRERVL